MGYFIVLEGPDGGGKSTQATLLSEHLEAEGYSCVVTQQPGGSEEGKRIREMLLDPGLAIDPKTELFLFLADRADHVGKIVKPALDAGKVVISSRYFYSTLVYQGIVRQVAPFEFLLQMNLFAVDDIIPDLVVYVDIDTGDGLNKARNSSTEIENYHGGDRIEREGVTFHQNVRRGYRKLAASNPDLFVTIDGTGRSREEIGAIIYSHVQGRMKDD